LRSLPPQHVAGEHRGGGHQLQAGTARYVRYCREQVTGVSFSREYFIRVDHLSLTGTAPLS